MPEPIAVLGPTATGKSAVAMALAEEIGGEIVNADALQVYRGFDIGTAKPGPAERARVRHHLIDILDPDERYSAGEFARRTRAQRVRSAFASRRRGGDTRGLHGGEQLGDTRPASDAIHLRGPARRAR